MTIRERLIELREVFFDWVSDLFLSLAKSFGYPNNPGMPILPTQTFFWNKPSFKDILSVRKLRFPPHVSPKNYIEVFLGSLPKPVPLVRHFYESHTDGYYNFYIENYKNIVFLPNWFSEFLQIRCNFCLDITFLEVFRETLFTILVCYYQIVQLRIFLGWLCNINPYIFPFNFFIALVDWLEESSYGFIPVFGGVSFSTPLLMSVVGKIADTVNHIVFTMPYLPSEGVPSFAIVDGEVKKVLNFTYLPILWYKYPIPQKVLEYWYYERPDIYAYYERAYGNIIKSIRFAELNLDTLIIFNLHSDFLQTIMDNFTYLTHLY